MSTPRDFGKSRILLSPLIWAPRLRKYASVVLSHEVCGYFSGQPVSCPFQLLDAACIPQCLVSSSDFKTSNDVHQSEPGKVIWLIRVSMFRLNPLRWYRNNPISRLVMFKPREGLPQVSFHSDCFEWKLCDKQPVQEGHCTLSSSPRIVGISLFCKGCPPCCRKAERDTLITSS